MKKLLALMGCFSISVSAFGVTSCTYINFYKKSLQNKINELVAVSSAALMGPIAGAAGTDGKFANSRVLSNKISNYTKNIDSSSVTSDMLTSYFGTDFNIFNLLNNGNIKGVSNEDAKTFIGNSFDSNIWKTVDGLYNVVYGILGQGFSADLVSVLVNAISGFGITPDIAHTIDSVLRNFSMTNLQNDFSSKISLVKTNQDYLFMFYSELINFLGSAAKNSTTDNYIINIQDYSLDKLIEKGNAKYSEAINLAMNPISKIITELLNGNVSWDFDSSELLNHIMILLSSLSLYMNSFQNLNNEDLKNNPEKINDANGTDTNLNFLFSSTQNNYTVITNNLKTSAFEKPQNISDVSFEGFSNLLKCFLEPTKIGKYQFERTLQMLFQSNEKTEGFRLITTPSKNDDTDNPGVPGNNKDGVLFDTVGNMFTLFIPKSGDWIANEDKRNLGLTPLLSGIMQGVLGKFLGSMGNILGVLGLGTEQLGIVVGNLISSILADNDNSNILNKAWVDLYDLKNNNKTLVGLLNAFIQIPWDTLIPTVKTFGLKIAPLFKNTLSNLFFSDKEDKISKNLYEMIFNTSSLDLERNKNNKNIRDIKINSSMSVIAELIESLPNILIVLLNLASATKLTDGVENISDIENIIVRDGNNSSTPIGQYDANKKVFILNGIEFNTKLSLALALMDKDRTGYKVFNTTTNEKMASIEYAESILGYVVVNNGQPKIIDGSLFSFLINLFNGETGNTTKKVLSYLKQFLDKKSDDFVDNQNDVVDAYLNKNNFKISDIISNNFEDSNKKSTLTYKISYNYQSVSLTYKVGIYLDPKIDRYYHFDSIEKI